MSEPRSLTSAQEEALARYRSGAMSGAERADFEREILVSDALAEALYSELALDAVRTTSAPARTRRWGAGLAVAAALVAVAGGALLLTRPAGRAPDPGETLRGGGEAAVVPLEPLGDLAGPPAWFRWRRDPGAESYRLEVFGPDGRNAATSVTADTAVAAAAIGADTLTAGTWRVVPIAADGHERPTPPAVRFGVPR